MSADQSGHSDAQFSGVLGRDYDTLKLICPAAAEMSRLVGLGVAEYVERMPYAESVLELGGGTGITTLSLLSAAPQLTVLSVDNEPTMQNRAQQHLRQWVDQGRLNFCGDDALTALKKTPANSIDIVASAYTLHNFVNTYRDLVIREIFRVLKPGGLFINGDRYGFDDLAQHTRCIKEEISQYFRVLIAENKLDVLEQWIVHLFGDESEDHVMREAPALGQLEDIGFIDIQLSDRIAVSAVVAAIKPW